MEPNNELELIDQVSKWAAYNFSHKRDPAWGVVEEIGEAAHACLKKFQGIRGYDETRFHLDFADSLGDAMIFLSDWCSLHQAYFKFNRNEKMVMVEDHDAIMAHVLQCASAMFRYPAMLTPTLNEGDVCSVVAQRVCTALEYWATFHKMDLKLITASVWIGVRKRDWIKFPKNGIDA